MHTSRWRSSFVVFIALSSTLAPAAGPPPAAATTPYTSIDSSGPLTEIVLGNELGCQVKYEDELDLQFFPPAEVPGDCGTLVTIGDEVYGPDFRARSTATGGLGIPFTPVSQSGVSGDGSATSPFVVTTEVAAGTTGVHLVQRDSYVTGRTSYLTTIGLENLGPTAVSAIVYRAGDCYLGGSDYGFGFVQAIGASSAVACSKTANNDPADRVEQWIPITRGSHYYQAGYSDVWDRIGARQPFDDTCLCEDEIDNGAGLSWEISLAPGGSASISHLTNFGLLAAGTTLTANPAVAEVLPDASLFFPSLSARLTDPMGEPVVGRSIDFFVGSSMVCSDVTDSDGVAACGDIATELAAIADGGYVALFSGDEFFLASADDAPLLHVAGTDLP